jgi:hypothetical protein
MPPLLKNSFYQSFPTTKAFAYNGIQSFRFENMPKAFAYNGIQSFRFENMPKAFALDSIIPDNFLAIFSRHH